MPHPLPPLVPPRATSSMNAIHPGFSRASHRRLLYCLATTIPHSTHYHCKPSPNRRAFVTTQNASLPPPPMPVGTTVHFHHIKPKFLQYSPISIAPHPPLPSQPTSIIGFTSNPPSPNISTIYPQCLPVRPELQERVAKQWLNSRSFWMVHHLPNPPTPKSPSTSNSPCSLLR